jgi:ATP-dependent DNA helicase RecG
MTVEKVSMDGGDVVVVEVEPAHFPPVKYKGKTCVRIGPRKGYANENDEKKLLEKRASHMLTFDALPCLGTTLDDIDVSLFRLSYLPRAYPLEVIENDSRDIRLQLQSLGFYDMRHNCPTNAGILMFGQNVERRFPGAYVQYVFFGGESRAGDIKREYKFAGNLMNMLYQLDTYVNTTISNRRPVPVSALREEYVCDYPSWAIRELLMNAVCHRDYESNGPVQFYQYDDRIEILNPGSLYGKATPQNFPWVNDYRNAVIAEAMKVLGFVNRFSRGVQRVQDELKLNGNAPAEFRLDFETAFLVKVSASGASGKAADEHLELHKKVKD